MGFVKAYGICIYKIEENVIKVLLCKSVQSLNRWGFLKGVQDNNETAQQTAIREFEEESSIKIEKSMLEEYFYQENLEKDIGIYLVNSSKIEDLDDYFEDDVLKSHFLSWENSKVKFFDIRELPLIKKKQSKIVKKICSFINS